MVHDSKPCSSYSKQRLPQFALLDVVVSGYIWTAAPTQTVAHNYRLWNFAAPGDHDQRSRRTDRSTELAGKSPRRRFAGFLRAAAAVGAGSVPGRLDVMGGIADYSGSLVLQLPLAEAVWAAIQDVDEAGWRVASLPQHAGDAARVVSFDGAEVDAFWRPTTGRPAIGCAAIRLDPGPRTSSACYSYSLANLGRTRGAVCGSWSDRTSPRQKG